MSEGRERFDRRDFLKVTAGTVASATVGLAGGQAVLGESSDDSQKYDFLMPRVKFKCTVNWVGDYWNCFPGGDRNLLIALRSVVRCKIKLPQNCRDDQPHHGDNTHFNAVVDFTDIKKLRNYPFLFMHSSGPYKFSDEEKKNVRKYVNEGGFLLIDDCDHRNKSLFYKSSYKMLEQAFGEGAVKRVPNEHEVFHTVYDLGDVGLPLVSGRNFGARGVFVDDRLAVFLSSSDIHCGWRDKYKPNAAKAVQLGINIIMYAISH